MPSCVPREWTKRMAVQENAASGRASDGPAAPVLTGLPVLLVIIIYLLGVTDLSWKSCLPVLPYGKILLNAGLVMASVGAAYLLAFLGMRKETIADAVRDETV